MFAKRGATLGEWRRFKELRSAFVPFEEFAAGARRDGPHATIIPKKREELRRNKKTSGAPRVPTVRRSAVQIKQMPISVTVGGPKIEGLELMSPAAPEFDAAVRSLFTGNSNELLKLKPFLTILSNRCDRTLVAYALKWEVALHAERRITTSQHKYPDAVAPGAPRRGNEIRPGEQQIVAMSIEIDCGRWGGGKRPKSFI